MALRAEASGYVWCLYSIARLEQRDSGTYVEIEAIALSRDIPAVLRWVVNPVVRRVSRNSMLVSLQKMKEAVRLTEDSELAAKLPTTSHNGSRVTVPLERHRSEFCSGPETVKSEPALKHSISSNTL